MNRILFTYIFSLFTLFSYCQENTWTIGLISSNWTYDYGGYLKYKYKNHAIQLYGQDVNRQYGLPKIMTEWPTEKGTTTGYNIGLNYDFQLNVDEVYKLFIQIGYLYRNTNGNDFFQPSQEFGYTFDLKEIYNTKIIGFGNRLDFKKVEINIIENFHFYSMTSKRFNHKIIYDYTASGVTKKDKTIIDKKMRFDIEISIGYKI